MDSLEKHTWTEYGSYMREMGVTLVVASVFLAFFWLLPSAELPQSHQKATAPAPQKEFAEVPVEADADIVYDLSTSSVLYGKNVHAQLPLASLTKLLTVYAAIDGLPLSTPITISDHATRVISPKVFSPGDVLSLGDLSRLTLTASLNDGAIAIADAVSKDRRQMDMLAGVAAALDLSQTYAMNGSGLDLTSSVSGGYGSAYDMARLAGALVYRAPDIALATTNNIVQAEAESGKRYVVKNTDPMVDSIPHLLLSKTGYTDLAGGNLALVFDAGLGHPIAVVVLGSSPQARFTDAKALVAATLAYFAGIKTYD